MAESFFDKIYKNKTQHTPDVLSCLANLSNDEVFTPPDVVNQMLDLLPQDLFQNPNTTFLEIIIPKWIQGVGIIKKCAFAV